MEGGRKTDEVARELGFSAATLYAWKSKYDVMQMSDENACGSSRKRTADSRMWWRM